MTNFQSLDHELSVEGLIGPKLLPIANSYNDVSVNLSALAPVLQASMEQIHQAYTFSIFTCHY